MIFFLKYSYIVRYSLFENYYLLVCYYLIICQRSIECYFLSFNKWKIVYTRLADFQGNKSSSTSSLLSSYRSITFFQSLSLAISSTSLNIWPIHFHLLLSIRHEYTWKKGQRYQILEKMKMKSVIRGTSACILHYFYILFLL